MQVRKLETTDGFLVTDLDGAPCGAGVVRAAPKVLVDGAELLARSVTYTFAAFGVQATGISAGVNAKPEARAEALAAFGAEVAPLAAEGCLHLVPSTGVDDPSALGELPAAALDADLLARGAVAAASAFASGTAAVAGPGAAEHADRLAELWPATGGTWAGAGELDADVDVLFVAGKAGVVDDEAALGIAARAVVALTPVPVTAKGFAVLERANRTFVPDQLSCAAPLLALAAGAPGAEGGDPVERVAALAAEVAAAAGDAGPQPWRLVVERAETFLGTWQPALPFGRPLA